MNFKVLVFVVGVIFVCDIADAQRLHIVHGYQMEGKTTHQHWKAWNQSIAHDSDVIRLITRNCPSSSLVVSQIIAKPGQRSKSAILNKIKTLNIQPQDSVMFYWSGHGAYDSKGHFLDLDQKERVYRSEIIEAMSSKAKLRICFTNCCAGLEADQVSKAPRRYTVQESKVIQPLLKRLFFESSGIVDINSSGKDELACLLSGTLDSSGQPEFGSTSGKALENFLSKNMNNGQLTWSNLLADLRRQVAAYYQKPCCEGVRSASPNQRTQTVHAFQLPGQYRLGMRIQNGQTGIQIVSVLPQSPGMKFIVKGQTYSLEAGDSIVSVNNKTIRNEQDFLHAVRLSGQEMYLTVINKNDGQRISGKITLNY